MPETFDGTPIAATATEQAQLAAFRTGAAVFTTLKEVVSVRGIDARSFLQSLVSQDVANLAPGEATDALLLQPQGKLIALMRMFVISEEHWLLLVDAGVGTALHDGLARFKIRVKVDLEISTDLVVACVRGPRAVEVTGYDASRSVMALDDGVLVPNSWDIVAGVDWVGPRVKLTAAVDEMVANGALAVTKGVYETARVSYGVVTQGVDINDRTIAQEAQLEVNAVSFTKGCFVGQELVCRIDSRGHVNRFVRLLRASDSSARFTVGDSVECQGTVVGEVTSVAAFDGVALATIRRTVDVGTEVSVGGSSAAVEQRFPSEPTNSASAD